jgi:5-methylcytosine-specific restriction endonuclease McrA
MTDSELEQLREAIHELEVEQERSAQAAAGFKANKAWALRNRARATAISRKSWLKTQYGMSPEEYARRLSEQDGGCALCGASCPTGNLLAVDHCHITGRVRGLLCANCNVALGTFKDDVSVLRKAIQYLQSS